MTATKPARAELVEALSRAPVTASRSGGFERTLSFSFRNDDDLDRAAAAWLLAEREHKAAG